MDNKTYILNKDEIAAKIKRLAYEVLENNAEVETIYLAGIMHNGLLICNSIKESIQAISKINIVIIPIDINKKDPQQIKVISNESFENKTIIIVDDVSMTGKTILYALKPFLNFYPAKIQTLVLIERQQKIYPIHSDYVGLHISTTLQDLIIVEENNNQLISAYLI